MVILLRKRTQAFTVSTLAVASVLISGLQSASANPNFTHAGILSFSTDPSKCQLKVRGFFETTSPRHVQYKYQWYVSGHNNTPVKTRTTTTYKPAPPGSKHPIVYGYWDDVIKLKKSTTGKIQLFIKSHTSSNWKGPMSREFNMNCGVKLNPNIIKPNGVRQQTAPAQQTAPRFNRDLKSR